MSYENRLSIAAELMASVNKVTRIAALSVLNDVVKDTPKDTGEAQGSWQVAIGSPTRKKRSKSRRASSAISEGNKNIASAITIEYPTIYITSLKPYMQRLNRGHSDQSDGFFVEKAIQKAGLGDIKLG